MNRGCPRKIHPPLSEPTNVSRAVRAERVPLGAPRLKLAIKEKNPNFVTRWVNDSGARLENAMDGGYRFVEHDVTIGTGDMASGDTDPGARMSKIVGTNEDGTPMRAYLMQIDRAMYEEDQDAKEEETKRTESAIRAGNPDGKASDGRYIPSEGIRLRS